MIGIVNGLAQISARMARMKGRIAGSLGLIALMLALGVQPPPAHAQTGGDIELLASSVTSELQEGIWFDIELRSAADIEEIAVRFRVGQRQIGAYEYLEISDSGGGDTVTASGFYRTNNAARYIAPGTIITYNFEITDVDGNRLDTPEAEHIYHDHRYEWHEISNGIVTVSYHGPVQSRAQVILDAIVQTLEVMGPLLGAGVDDPVRVTMYNNWGEMRWALPPDSETTRQNLITEGQAHSEEGVLVVLGDAARVSGVASHEVIHILVHRAGEGTLGRMPSWLNEGLAEFGSVDRSLSFDRYLAHALRNDKLLPITAMDRPPGTPEDVLIFYGQARSIVTYMVEAYGAEKMRELMATIKSGKSAGTAVEEVYGVTLIELENEWRSLLGAPLRQTPDEASALPTPWPSPTLGLMSIDDLRQQGGGSATAVPAAATAAPAPTPTPMPTQPAQPASAQPTTAPEPTPEPAAAIPARAEQPASEPPAPASDSAANSTQNEPDDAPSGGACGAPANGSVVEMSSIALLAGIALRWLRRRRN